MHIYGKYHYLKPIGGEFINKEELYRLHSELWNWLSENPEATKADWPLWINYLGAYINGACFACVYTDDYRDRKCHNCLVDWGTDNCQDLESPYYKWRRCRNLLKRSFYARSIALLPLKEDY